MKLLEDLLVDKKNKIKMKKSDSDIIQTASRIL